MFRRFKKKREKSLEEINAPSDIDKLMDIDKGLIIITGPTNEARVNLVKNIIQRTFYNDKIALIGECDENIDTNHSVEYYNSCNMNELIPGEHNVVIIKEFQGTHKVDLAIQAIEKGSIVYALSGTSSMIDFPEVISTIYPDSTKNQIKSVISKYLVGVISQTLNPYNNEKLDISVKVN